MNIRLHQLNFRQFQLLLLRQVIQGHQFTGKIICLNTSQTSCFNYSDKKFDKILHLIITNFNMYLNTTSNLYLVNNL